MSPRPAALVVLNPASRNGGARRLYRRVRDEIASRFDVREVELDSGGSWQDEIPRAVRAGIRTFLAAGGDGTVSAVASALLERSDGVPISELSLGAIGLGSSNDFHKPFRTVRGDIPLRIDARAAVPRDLVRATYEDGHGVQVRRVFLVSASLGATASANAFFNQGDRVLRLLKGGCPGAAILYAAVRTILRHRRIPAVLTLVGGSESVEISNLSVLKTPYLSGSFVYDTVVDPASGFLAVNLCAGMSRRRLFATLFSLWRGSFLGLPDTRHWMAQRLGVELDLPSDLELDGEVVRARRVSFEVLPERLRICA